jgi:hypothetical protein
VDDGFCPLIMRWRRERQRQAASAKSEQGSSEGASGESQEGGDGASSNSYTRNRNGERAAEERPYDWQRHPATRRAPDRPAPSFSTVGRPDQASGWGQALLYGGGLTLMALVLAMGWSIGRPRPRDRRPPLPAPAWARRRRR